MKLIFGRFKIISIFQKSFAKSLNKGSFTCECHKGFTTSDGGVTCEDIDECALTGKEKVCENATCKNTPGAYECTCNAGYKHKYADDITSDCDDIDECKEPR